MTNVFGPILAVGTAISPQAGTPANHEIQLSKEEVASKYSFEDEMYVALNDATYIAYHDAKREHEGGNDEGGEGPKPLPKIVQDFISGQYTLEELEAKDIKKILDACSKYQVAINKMKAKNGGQNSPETLTMEENLRSVGKAFKGLVKVDLSSFPDVINRAWNTNPQPHVGHWNVLSKDGKKHNEVDVPFYGVELAKRTSFNRKTDRATYQYVSIVFNPMTQQFDFLFYTDLVEGCDYAFNQYNIMSGRTYHVKTLIDLTVTDEEHNKKFKENIEKADKILVVAMDKLLRLYQNKIFPVSTLTDEQKKSLYEKCFQITLMGGNMDKYRELEATIASWDTEFAANLASTKEQYIGYIDGDETSDIDSLKDKYTKLINGAKNSDDVKTTYKQYQKEKKESLDTRETNLKALADHQSSLVKEITYDPSNLPDLQKEYITKIKVSTTTTEADAVYQEYLTKRDAELLAQGNTVSAGTEKTPEEINDEKEKARIRIANKQWATEFEQNLDKLSTSNKAVYNYIIDTYKGFSSDKTAYSDEYNRLTMKYQSIRKQAFQVSKMTIKTDAKTLISEVTDSIKGAKTAKEFYSNHRLLKKTINSIFTEYNNIPDGARSDALKTQILLVEAARTQYLEAWDAFDDMYREFFGLHKKIKSAEGSPDTEDVNRTLKIEFEEFSPAFEGYTPQFNHLLDACNKLYEAVR